MEDCFICRKHQGVATELQGPAGPLYADDLVYLSHAQLIGDANAQYLGYLFLETRRHVGKLGQLHDDEAQRLGLLTKYAAAALMQTEGVEHVYSFVLGDGVPHIHIHLIGRYPGTPREYWGIRLDEWPEAPRGGLPALTEISQRLKAYLAAQPALQNGGFPDMLGFGE